MTQRATTQQAREHVHAFAHPITIERQLGEPHADCKRRIAGNERRERQFRSAACPSDEREQFIENGNLRLCGERHDQRLSIGPQRRRQREVAVDVAHRKRQRELGHRARQAHRRTRRRRFQVEQEAATRTPAHHRTQRIGRQLQVADIEFELADRALELHRRADVADERDLHRREREPQQ